MDYARSASKPKLNFNCLAMKTLRLLLFTDAAFGNRSYFTSQLRLFVVLADINGHANIIHYGSQKYKRITWSGIASELLGLSAAFDETFCVMHILEELLCIKIPVHVYIDSRTTCNCVARNSATTTKRLQIDAVALRHSVNRGEITSIS